MLSTVIAPLSVFIGDIGAIILDKVCGVKQIMMVECDKAVISRAVCVCMYVWKSTASYSTKWRPPSRDVELVDKGIYDTHTHTHPLHCIPSL